MTGLSGPSTISSRSWGSPTSQDIRRPFGTNPRLGVPNHGRTPGPIFLGNYSRKAFRSLELSWRRNHSKSLPIGPWGATYCCYRLGLAAKVSLVQWPLVQFQFGASKGNKGPWVAFLWGAASKTAQGFPQRGTTGFPSYHSGVLFPPFGFPRAQGQKFPFPRVPGSKILPGLKGFLGNGIQTFFTGVFGARPPGASSGPGKRATGGKKQEKPGFSPPPGGFRKRNLSPFQEKGQGFTQGELVWVNLVHGLGWLSTQGLKVGIFSLSRFFGGFKPPF